MAYINGNPKTKKAAKELVKQGRVTAFEPGPFGEIPYNGVVYVEGPHYPAPHTWYGKAVVKDGVIIKLT